MLPPAFNDAVRRVLTESGWSADRMFDSAHARSAHAARALTLHPAAERFVRSYGGLTLPEQLRGPGPVLCPVEALACMSDERIASTQAWLGESFAVLGFAGSRDKILLMSARGAVYAASEYVLVCYGTNLADLFERLCAADRLRAGTWN